MKNAESFNLRWDNFEANTRVALKELRDETEFCDVTLACANGKQVSAHKVILAGGSKFFQQILKQNPHPHPLLYLKGVRYDYLLSILDFVYTGEANINQKEIESFFDVANDLQIKGLIDKNTPQKNSSKEGDMMSRNVSCQNDRSNVRVIPYQINKFETSCQTIIPIFGVREGFWVKIKKKLFQQFQLMASLPISDGLRLSG